MHTRAELPYPGTPDLPLLSRLFPAYEIYYYMWTNTRVESLAPSTKPHDSYILEIHTRGMCLWNRFPPISNPHKISTKLCRLFAKYRVGLGLVLIVHFKRKMCYLGCICGILVVYCSQCPINLPVTISCIIVDEWVYYYYLVLASLMYKFTIGNYIKI